MTVTPGSGDPSDLPAVARVRDPYGLQPPHNKPLRHGSFVNADISGKSYQGLVRLPRHLVRAGGNIWVIDEQLRLRNRAVSLLRAGGDQVFVSAGLEPGDLVSLTALDNSFTGALVEVVSQTTTDLLPGTEAETTPETDGTSGSNSIRIAEESADSGAGAE